MQRRSRLWTVLTAGVLISSFAGLAQPTAAQEKTPMEAPLPPDEAGLPERGDPLAPGAEPDVMYLKQPSAEAPETLPPPSTTLTDDQEKQALEFYRTESPELVPGLEALKKTQPKLYRSELRTAYRDWQSLTKLQKENPTRYEESRRERALERASRELTRRYKQASQAAEHQRLRTELQQVLDELFELREKRREATIERLERDLAKLRETTEKRRQNKMRIVANRLADLLGGDEDLRW